MKNKLFVIFCAHYGLLHSTDMGKIFVTWGSRKRSSGPVSERNFPDKEDARLSLKTPSLSELILVLYYKEPDKVAARKAKKYLPEASQVEFITAWAHDLI